MNDDDDDHRYDNQQNDVSILYAQNTHTYTGIRNSRTHNLKMTTLFCQRTINDKNRITTVTASSELQFFKPPSMATYKTTLSAQQIVFIYICGIY